jgi:hypothetical protein
MVMVRRKERILGATVAAPAPIMKETEPKLSAQS